MSFDQYDKSFISENKLNFEEGKEINEKSVRFTDRKEFDLNIENIINNKQIQDKTL